MAGLAEDAELKCEYCGITRQAHWEKYDKKHLKTVEDYEDGYCLRFACIKCFQEHRDEISADKTKRLIQKVREKDLVLKRSKAHKDYEKLSTWQSQFRPEVKHSNVTKTILRKQRDKESEKNGKITTDMKEARDLFLAKDDNGETWPDRRGGATVLCEGEEEIDKPIKVRG